MRILIAVSLLALAGCAMPPTAHMMVEECVMQLRDEATTGWIARRPDPDFGLWDEGAARLYCQSRYLGR